MTDRVIVPEVVEPDEMLPSDLQTLRRFAVLLDGAFNIPGTRKKVGLDALAGLIPGVGDALGAVMSTWILVGAVRHRVPFGVLLRMILNVLADLTIGAVPVVGDLFDLFWKQNIGNVDLLVRNRNRRKGPRSTGTLVVVAGIIFLVIIGLVGALVVVMAQAILALRDFY